MTRDDLLDWVCSLPGGAGGRDEVSRLVDSPGLRGEYSRALATRDRLAERRRRVRLMRSPYRGRRQPRRPSFAERKKSLLGVLDARLAAAERHADVCATAIYINKF